MYRNNVQSNKDFSRLPRSEKLYILSQICIHNMVTPDTPGYVGLIIRVCTSKFAMSRETAETYAADLKSAYEADYWEGLAAKHQPETDSVEAEPTTNTPRVFEDTPKTLDALNKLNFQSSTPIKTVPKQLVLEPQIAPATIAKQLLQMARNEDFNGVGRINLHEARYDLDDKTLQCRDIIQLLKQFYPSLDAEQRAGNNILVYFGGKEGMRNLRNLHRIVQNPAPTMKTITYTPPEPILERDADKANKDLVGSVVEDIDEDVPEVD